MRKLLILPIILFTMPATSFAQKPRFDHLAIYVVDLEKSAAFYKNIIGLDTLANPFNDNRHVWFAIGGGNELHIISGAASVAVHPRNNHLCFSVAALEPFIQNLNRSHISWQNAKGEDNQITIRPDGVKQIYFTDPDGYWIEVNDAPEK